MSYIKMERLAMRDDFERMYGIRLREDDELLPIIHFITKSTSSIEVSNSESRRVLEDLKREAQQVLSQSSDHVTRGIELTQRFTDDSVKLSKFLFDHYGNELKKLKLEIREVQKSIQSIPKIPSEVKVNSVRSFETKTMNFFWKYFLASFPLAIVGFVLASHYYYEKEEVRRKYKPSQTEWLYQFFEYSKSNSPQAVEDYVNKNPIPSN